MPPTFDEQWGDGRSKPIRACRARFSGYANHYGPDLTPPMATLIRRLVWAEGQAISWEAEIAEAERKGRKISTLESPRYLAIVDRVNSLIRQLDAMTNAKNGAADDHHIAAMYADAMERATQEHVMPRAPTEKPVEKPKAKRTKELAPPRALAAPRVPPETPTPPAPATEGASIIDFTTRRLRTE